MNQTSSTAGNSQDMVISYLRLRQAIGVVQGLRDRADQCSLSDTGNWTNQNVVYTKALVDMFPLALTILKGARLRDECRGAHYKPDFALPGIEADDSAERHRLAERDNCNRCANDVCNWHLSLR